MLKFLAIVKRLYGRWRWWTPLLYVATGFGLIVLWFVVDGKTTWVTPPTRPLDPVSVYVMDFGYHTALVLPSFEEQKVTKYGFGDWRFYALGERGTMSAASALLWPTPSAFGRGDFPRTPEETESVSVLEILVDRDKVLRLRQRLDQLHQASETPPRFEKASGLWFVPDPRSYFWRENCNTTLRDWLEELGCECDGVAWWADFRLRPNQA